MTENKLFNLSLFVTAIVTSYIWVLLIWAYYHGGVISHHILDRKDLPAISNWWGGLLLPVLTWLLLFRIRTRIKKQNLKKTGSEKSMPNILFGFTGALLFGIALAVSFTFGYSTDYLIYVLMVLVFIVPVFRAEYILGFVIGMVFTFGAILPTAFAVIVAIISAIVYTLIHPLLMRIIKIVRR